jgi:pimeloyl-ACP methyl ester carboxylesterase
MSLTRFRGPAEPVAMSHRLAIAFLTVTTVLAATACGSDDQPAAGSTPTSPAPATPTAPPTAPKPKPTPPKPLGPITPSGRPTMTSPPSPAASIGAYCLEPGDPARKVTFPAGNGATLTGALLGKGRAGVVLVHQSDGDLCQWLPYARELAKAGYLVLTMDLESVGSAGYVQYVGDQPVPYAIDVAGATRFLRSRGAAKVVLVGASMGGTVVLAAGAITRPAVDGVIAVSASIEYGGIDARTAARRLTMPALYVAAAQDRDYEAVAKTLSAATKSSRSVTVVPGSAHGVGLVEPPGDATVRRDVSAFLAAHAR